MGKLIIPGWYHCCDCARSVAVGLSGLDKGKFGAASDADSHMA